VTTETATETEMTVVTVTTVIVRTRETVIDMRNEDIVQDHTQTQNRHQKAVTEETIVKRRRKREDVQEAD
jgi:hypothetical protein